MLDLICGCSERLSREPRGQQADVRTHSRARASADGNDGGGIGRHTAGVHVERFGVVALMCAPELPAHDACGCPAATVIVFTDVGLEGEVASGTGRGVIVASVCAELGAL